MTNDALTEFPEQRLTKALMRIGAELQGRNQSDQRLGELFEVLTHYGREMDVNPQTLNDHDSRFSEPAEDSRGNHQLPVLMAMLQDTMTRLRCRVSKVVERIEVHDTARQANARYGGVAGWELASQTPHVFLDQS